MAYRGLELDKKNVYVIIDLVKVMMEKISIGLEPDNALKRALEIVARRGPKPIRPESIMNNHCKVRLGLDRDKFVNFVITGRIIDRLREKYPNHSNLITDKLGPLYA